MKTLTKVNIDRKPITSEEINKYKNFDTILNQFPGYTTPRYKTGWFITGLAGTLILLGCIAFLGIF